jgi:hypothetical protein
MITYERHPVLEVHLQWHVVGGGDDDGGDGCYYPLSRHESRIIVVLKPSLFVMLLPNIIY